MKKSKAGCRTPEVKDLRSVQKFRKIEGDYHARAP